MDERHRQHQLERPQLAQPITSSKDGIKLAAAVIGLEFHHLFIRRHQARGDLYTSTNGGATWTNETTGTSLSGLGWNSITSSSDGTRLAAVDGNNIYTSTNSGATWTNDTASTSLSGLGWGSIASSQVGTRLFVSVDVGDLYTSTNGGATWTNETTGTSLSGLGWGDCNGTDSLVSSADGTHLAALADGGDIYTSADGGTTWTDQTSAGPRNWCGISSSQDGTMLAAVDGGGDIWTGVFTTPAPAPTPPPSGGGMIVGSGPLAPSAQGLPGYVPPRPQIDYSNGTVVYLDATTTVSTSTSTAPTTTASSTPITTPQTTLSASSSPFLIDRQLWDQGPDILLLQKFLNTHGYVLTLTGPGSPGSQTNFFGVKTYQALIKFQQAKNLPATGFFGPLTRAAINSL